MALKSKAAVTNVTMIIVSVLLIAIHRRRCDVAHELAMSLMVDHVSEVTLHQCA